MAEITVEAESAERYRVTVAEEGGRTEHRVTVGDTFYDPFAEVAGSCERLIVASFEFLLEREPKEAILREFDLTVISNYFPEYEEELRARLSA